VSDFLNHLASRTFGFTPTIRPHLTALFEPLRWATPQFAGLASQAGIEQSSFSEDIAESVLRQDQFSIHRPVGVTPALGETRTPSAESQMEQPSFLASPDLGARPFGTDQPEPPEDTAASFGVRSTEYRPEGNLRSFMPQQVSQVAPSGRDRETEDGDILPPNARESSSEGELSRPDALSAMRVGSTAKVDATGHLLATLADSSRLADGKPIPVVRLPATLPIALSRLSRGLDCFRRTARESAVEQGNSEPVIQVSIGRIEVKATQPRDSSARVERPPSSVMTLDEYLRRRTKRGGE
jgi:hypothetical protein